MVVVCMLAALPCFAFLRLPVFLAFFPSCSFLLAGFLFTFLSIALICVFPAFGVLNVLWSGARARERKRDSLLRCSQSRAQTFSLSLFFFLLSVSGPLPFAHPLYLLISSPIVHTTTKKNDQHRGGRQSNNNNAAAASTAQTTTTTTARILYHGSEA